MNSTTKQIIDAIEKRRKALEMPRNFLAKESGVSYRQLCRFLNGKKTRITFNSVYDAMKVLGLSLEFELVDKPRGK